MRHVLLTGATGFLGSRLLHRLVRGPDPCRVTILKRSFSNTHRIADLLAEVRHHNLDEVGVADVFAADAYDTIVHCATDYGRRPVPRAEVIESNLLLPLRLLEAGRQHGVRTFLNTDTMLDKNVSDYTLSKRQFHEWLQATAGSVAAVNVALEHFYGPGDDPSKFTTEMIRALIRGEGSIRLTPGEQCRDFIYIDDVVEAMWRILAHSHEAPQPFSEYQVGTGQTVRLRDFVTLIARMCGNTTTSLEFGALPYRPNEPMTVQVDTTGLEALGWAPRWTLQEGLGETIRFEQEALSLT